MRARATCRSVIEETPAKHEYTIDDPPAHVAAFVLWAYAKSAPPAPTPATLPLLLTFAAKWDAPQLRGFCDDAAAGWQVRGCASCELT